MVAVTLPLCGPGSRFVESILTEMDGPYPLEYETEPSIGSLELMINQFLPSDVVPVTVTSPRIALQLVKDRASDVFMF